MLPPTNDRPPATRRVLLVVGVVALIVAGGVVADNLFFRDRPPPVDFTAFWSAGRLNAEGTNPYDPVAVRSTQRGIGHEADAAVMMWNPPWVLTLVMPFGLLPFRTAYGFWALTHLALVLGSAELLWRGFTPSGTFRGQRWVAYLITLTFVPTTYLIGIGQITAVVLAGLAGFLVLRQCGRPFLAGAAAAVTAAKPHLLTLFAAWLLLDVFGGRAGRWVVLGGILVGVVMCIPPTLSNADVWVQYQVAVAAPADADHISVKDWLTPVMASWIRRELPGQPFWVQFVPLVLVVPTFCVWYLQQGHRTEPATLLGWVVGVSLLIAPYGAWPFDLVLLLIPVLATAARVVAAPNRSAVVTGVVWLTVMNVALMAMMLDRTSSEWYVWVTPWVLVGCGVVQSLAGRQPFAGTEPACLVLPSDNVAAGEA